MTGQINFFKKYEKKVKKCENNTLFTFNQIFIRKIMQISNNSKQNMGKTDKHPVTEMEQLAAAITEGTKTTLQGLLNEAVCDYLREEILSEEDDEQDEVEGAEETESSDVPEFGESSDDADAVEADDEEAPEEADDAEEVVDTDNAEDEGDEWADFDDYKVGDDEGSEEYDFTSETDTDTLVKVFKLMKNDDQVSVVKTGDKVSIKDNEADTEYVIELGGDSEDEDNFDFEGEMTMESLGYTTNYQKKDAIAGLTMGDSPKNTKDWDEGAPKGTERPYGKPGKNDPFGKKTEKVFEITLNDDVLEDEVQVDEQKNIGGFVQQNSVTGSYLSNSNGRRARNGHKEGRQVTGTADSRYSSQTNESLQKKINAALQENKQLKETVAKVSKIMKEAVQVNVNLGHIVRLMVENTTTKAEKEDIVKRYASVKSNDEAKALYESISSELNKTHSTIIKEQATTVEPSKQINESKIYDEPNSVRDMMKRMGML